MSSGCIEELRFLEKAVARASICAAPVTVAAGALWRGASLDARNLEKGAVALRENQPADRRRVIIG
ncbi:MULTISPECIES: hypothetical protein [unclassified Caballeronia]|uniref:hypothetical protein n=1 Tax=unclassified Caballeronia TaxID=2646786 RepID=UPI0028576433|nr:MULTISPECIES: hypothetical protein [unclassified Caballeronia]MDR5736608.1 hypothetical protein [Caballeronia sp. LZ016]MDR5810912.1 hypothetical protein [Caballeronia sp. LZ019]